MGVCSRLPGIWRKSLQNPQNMYADVEASTKKSSRENKGGGPTVQAICLRTCTCVEANYFQFLITKERRG